MVGLFSTLDIVIFFGTLLGVMALGLWAGRKEADSEDYFLAGRKTRWWGVAGSIFGSNVSANHIVGMMGVGFTFGFAQSHFEISAIAGLLLLCYGFLPVYRKLRVYTLSEYLSRRYDDMSRVSYAGIMCIIMVVIMMVPGFYIGSRSLSILLKTDATATARAVVGSDGKITGIVLVRKGQGYADAPVVEIAAPLKNDKPDPDNAAKATATIQDGKVTGFAITVAGSGYDSEQPPAVALKGGASFRSGLSPGDIDPTWYIIGILLMALVTGTYTILGGLKAVIVTDVLQSVLMIVAALLVAFLTFGQLEIGGWAGMRALDAAENGGKELVHLYLPADHKALPWTGVLSGLMVLHFYYWGANQFIVQRALSTETNREARFGIIFAGFFKLLIPFMSIGTGIAAYYLFQKRGIPVDQDVAFPMLMKHVVAPVGFGVVGIISAGLIGAILSSLDSMMNSASTIVTFDIYKRFINPEASEKKLVSVGRMWIAIFIVAAAIITIFTMDPNSKESFFLHVASHQSKLIAGIVVAFGLGMLWPRATAAGGVVAIVSGVVFSYALPPIYAVTLGTIDGFYFGPQLNFMHSVMVAAILALILHVTVSLLTQPDAEKGKMTWTGLGGHDAAVLKRSALGLGASLLVFAVLAVLMVVEVFPPVVCAVIGALWTWGLFILAAKRAVAHADANPTETGERDAGRTILTDDRFLAGLLAAVAVFMMYYFY